MVQHTCLDQAIYRVTDKERWEEYRKNQEEKEKAEAEAAEEQVSLRGSQSPRVAVLTDANHAE